ncbi:MAG: DNA translocase FtsK, partial [Mariprofundales bacterium]
EHQDEDEDDNNENHNDNATQELNNEPHVHWDAVATDGEEDSLAMNLDADDLKNIPADMFERAISEDDESPNMATLEIKGPSYEDEQAAMRADHFAIEDDEENDDFDFSIDTPDEAGFLLPHIGLFHCVDQDKLRRSQQELDEQAQLLEDKLQDYRVSGQVLQAQQGPVVTQYKYEPSPGTKVSKVIGLQEDLSRSMAAISVRVAGNIPGENAIGIEVANENRDTVYIYDVLASDAFQRGGHVLPLCLGVDIAGEAVITDLATMPHLLVAGTTGSGKSVAINTMICSMLMRHTPDRLRMIMVDPKMLELSTYADIPHLLTPVVTDPKQAAKALAWAAYEMDRRYSIMAEARVRNIAGYNRIVADEGNHLPYIVVIIDELSDLMMTAGKEVEQHICRLAQKARAAGIHLILATQRPSVDVITGLIKANLPSRIAFQVSSRIDSRTILDQSGAECLLGNGDMLFLNSGRNVMRVHGAFISEGEVQALAEHLKRQADPQYDDAIFASLESEDEDNDEHLDDKYDEAIQLIIDKGQASISMIQRNLRIGYPRAANIIEQMERDGLVTPPKSGGMRDVLARRPDEEENF